MFRKIIFIVVLALCIVCKVQGAANYFGGYQDNTWENGSNWTAGLPASDHECYINGGKNVTLSSGTHYINQLSLGYTTDVLNTLTVDGGTLETGSGGSMRIGGLWASELGQGTLNLVSGSVGCNVMYVGHHGDGIVNVYGGTLRPWGLLQLGGGPGGIGVINLFDGLIDITDLSMYDENQSIVITDGLLDISGEWGTPVPDVLQYITDGLISAALGYELKTQLQNEDNGILIWAEEIPEPATLILLGFGGLLLRKRKCYQK